MEQTLSGDTAEAFAAVVRDALIEGQSISVPGLGTFSVQHEPSRVNERLDGSDEMLPPRDTIKFESETQSPW